MLAPLGGVRGVACGGIENEAVALVVHEAGAQDQSACFAAWAYAMETVLMRVNRIDEVLEPKYRGRGQYSRI